jgi:hypothetical protein
MSAASLYQSFVSSLDVTVWAVNIPGAELNVGEEFTLRVRVRNIAPTGNSRPDLAFRNVRVQVARQLPYAEHVAPGSPASIISDLQGYGSVLTRGESGTVDFRMRAKTAILNSTIPGLIPEKVASVHVFADVDQDRFFRIKKMNIDAIVDIVTT